MKGWRIKNFPIKYLDCIFDVGFTSVHSVGIDSPVGDHELIACTHGAGASGSQYFQGKH